MQQQTSVASDISESEPEQEERHERDRDRDREREREREPERELRRGMCIVVCIVHISIAPANIPMPADARAELVFFEKVKRRLNSMSLYREFLKCLNLFSQEVLTRNELIILVKELLGRHPDLFKEFKKFLQQEPDQAAAYGHLPFGELEYSATAKYGPSYRRLPAKYPLPPCSGRQFVEGEATLFNDRLVSVPMGSEDFSTFKRYDCREIESINHSIIVLARISLRSSCSAQKMIDLN